MVEYLTSKVYADPSEEGKGMLGEDGKRDELMEYSRVR